MKFKFLFSLPIVMLATLSVNRANADTEIRESRLVSGDYTCALNDNSDDVKRMIKETQSTFRLGGVIKNFDLSVAAGDLSKNYKDARAIIKINDAATNSLKVFDADLRETHLVFDKGNVISLEHKLLVSVRRSDMNHGKILPAENFYDALTVAIKLHNTEVGDYYYGFYSCGSKGAPSLVIEKTILKKFVCDTTDGSALRIEFSAAIFTDGWYTRFHSDDYDFDLPDDQQRTDLVSVHPETSAFRALLAKPLSIVTIPIGKQKYLKVWGNSESYLQLSESDGYRTGVLAKKAGAGQAASVQNVKCKVSTP